MFTPVPIEDGTIGGFYNTSFETTAKVIAARRLRCVRQICESSMLAKTVKGFVQTLLDVFADNQYEAPFAAIYTAEAVSPTKDTGFTAVATASTGTVNTLSPPAVEIAIPSVLASPEPYAYDPPATASTHWSQLHTLHHQTTSHSSHSHSYSNSNTQSYTQIDHYKLTLGGSLGIPEQPEGISHPLLPKSFMAQLEIGSGEGHIFGNGEAAHTRTGTADSRVSLTTAPPTVSISVSADSTNVSEAPSGTESPTSVSFDTGASTFAEEPTPIADPFEKADIAAALEAAVDGAPAIITSLASTSSSAVTSPATSESTAMPASATRALSMDDGSLGFISQVDFMPNTNSPVPTMSTLTPSGGSTISAHSGVHAAAPAVTFDWTPYIAQAVRQGRAVLVDMLPPAFMEDVGVKRGWKDKVRQAIVIPVTAEGDGGELAVVILGSSNASCLSVQIH